MVPIGDVLTTTDESKTQIKRLLRVIGTKVALVEATSEALEAVGARDAQGFYTHSGYHGLEQQL